MCGIAGVINFNNKPVEESRLLQMMQAMKHRGRDDEGVFIENNMGFGFVRLSIIDLSSAGHQPMQSADGRYTLIFNGEIYNYIELRETLQTKYAFKTSSDTEVILAAYQEWGEDCLHRFNGMFALAIYDSVHQTVFGARDRFGVKPFYYYKDADALIFASEIPAILSVLKSRPKANEQAVFDYLAFNRTDHTKETFFEGIFKLQHGQKFKVEQGGFTISTWYSLRQSKAAGFETPQEFRQVFSDAVKLRLRSDVPVGVSLSGGLDSSSIVSTMLTDFKKDDLNTFSAVYGHNELGDESGFINIYKPLVKNMYTVLPTAASLYNDLEDFVRTHAEPVPSTSVYAQYKVMEVVSKHVTVTLDGQGADEYLAGYPYFFGFYFKDLLKSWKLKTLSTEMAAYLKIHRSLYGIKTFAYFMLPDHLKTSLRSSEHGYISRSFIASHANTNKVVLNLYGAASLQEAVYDHFEYKLEHLLKWADRNSMRFSVETRSPFLDYTLVERTMATPAHEKINRGTLKHLLREAMTGTLPEKIRTRQDKVGFETPSNKWFREKIFSDFILELIRSDSFKSRPFFNSKVVEELYLGHLSGKANISQEIWKWINLELWYRYFID